MKGTSLHQLDLFDDSLITQPNQAFTPRQILEQFARGEVVPSEYQPSDTIIDDGTNEDQLVNEVIEFEDKIDAENHLIENQYALYHEPATNESGAPVPNGTPESSVQTPAGYDGQPGGEGEIA